jgi:hypothetical protein
MADFDKELETIKELLTKTYEDGYERGKREGRQESFDRGEVHRHKKLEEKGTSFNVGDKVCTTANYDWAGCKVFACGTVGTIVEKHMSKIYNIMLYEVKSEDELQTYLYGAADLELVEPAEVPVKIGSIVKIVKEYNDYNPSCHLFSKGTLGIVTDIREDRQEHSTNGSYKYRIENTNDIFFYDRDGFEVITRVEEDK